MNEMHADENDIYEQNPKIIHKLVLTGGKNSQLFNKLLPVMKCKNYTMAFTSQCSWILEDFLIKNL